MRLTAGLMAHAPSAPPLRGLVPDNSMANGVRTTITNEFVEELPRLALPRTPGSADAGAFSHRLWNRH